jgi:hypothetical protein
MKDYASNIPRYDQKHVTWQAMAKVASTLCQQPLTDQDVTTNMCSWDSFPDELVHWIVEGAYTRVVYRELGKLVGAKEPKQKYGEITTKWVMNRGNLKKTHSILQRSSIYPESGS